MRSISQERRQEGNVLWLDLLRRYPGFSLLPNYRLSLSLFPSISLSLSLFLSLEPVGSWAYDRSSCKKKGRWSKKFLSRSGKRTTPEVIRAGFFGRRVISMTLSLFYRLCLQRRSSRGGCGECIEADDLHELVNRFFDQPTRTCLEQRARRAPSRHFDASSAPAK
jgi:hypothetical protein